MEMAEKSKELKQQQYHGNMGEPRQKQRKLNLVENDADVHAVEANTIITINYDCLERIFDFLDIKSLLMVAHTCKRLQIAAITKFGRKKVWLDLYIFRFTVPTILEHQNEIFVYGLEFCLPFLRCFGAKISHLFVRSNHDCVDRYINQYCANTLTCIEFDSKLHFSSDIFKKQFNKVETVEIKECHLWKQLTNFANYFPNVRCLKVDSCRFNEFAPLAVSFSRLEQLELTSLGRSYLLVKILQASPQLRHLAIRQSDTFPLSKILDVIRTNPLITKLEVENPMVPVNAEFRRLSSWQDISSANANELNRFVAEHPLVEELILKDHRLTTADAINFIWQMTSLKRIGFVVTDLLGRNRIRNVLNNEWEMKNLDVQRPLYTELSR